MTIEKTVATLNGNLVIVSATENRSEIGGVKRHWFSMAQMRVDFTNDGLHFYRLWLEYAPDAIPATIDNADAALAAATIEFADKIETAANLPVLDMVSRYGNGEYVADLRNSAWWADR